MKYEKGNWTVFRQCCTSGNCFECRGLPQRGPIQVVQASGYSERYAKFVADHWQRYNAKAVQT